MFMETMQYVYYQVLSWVRHLFPNFLTQHIHLHGSGLPLALQHDETNSLPITVSELSHAPEEALALQQSISSNEETLSTIPIEVLELILKHLDYKSLYNLSITGKVFFCNLTLSLAKRVSERFMLIAKSMDTCQTNILNLVRESKYRTGDDISSQILRVCAHNDYIDCAISKKSDDQAVIIFTNSPGIAIVHYPSWTYEDLQFAPFLAGKDITSCAYSENYFIIVTTEDLTILKLVPNNSSVNICLLASATTYRMFCTKSVFNIKRLSATINDLFIVFPDAASTFNNVVALSVKDNTPAIVPVEFTSDQFDLDASLVILSYSENREPSPCANKEIITCFCKNTNKILAFTLHNVQMHNSKINIELKSLTQENMIYKDLDICQQRINREYSKLLSYDYTVGKDEFSKNLLNPYKRKLKNQLLKDKPLPISIAQRTNTLSM